tara:strand:+ start:2156 stop:3544 length:1389 start_codon:yes stop_codon:yes gene_type:complete
MRLLNILIFFLTISPLALLSQNEGDAIFIKEIHDHILNEGKCYSWLETLSEEIGGRLTGSDNAAKAVEYTGQEMSKIADQVTYQEIMVPHWIRGAQEKTHIVGSDGSILRELNVTALGNSIGSGSQGVTGQVAEVKSLDEVRSLGKEKLSGKIVFFNRPMDPTLVNTFHAYGGAGDQRVNGPAVAAEQGAVGAIVRSLTTLTDNLPHTGTLRYKEGVPTIPAVAVSTMHADELSKELSNGPVILYIETHSEILSDKPSHNVVAEIKGSEFPDEIILVGGHLDSWDLAGGAHDDGAGCVHSMEVMNALKALNYTPKRTLRVVLFMNEENGLAGGREYARISKEKGEFHLAAMESDAGGFTPRGFSFDAEDEMFAGLYRQITALSPFLEPYNLHFSKGGSGADIGPLKNQKGLLIGFRPDSQRYFDFHHSAADNITAVNERELKLGAAAMTSLIYLIDKYGLEH